MAVGTKTGQEVQTAGGTVDYAQVREQLERLLVHPLFANSKRYPALLAYTVTQTLEGNPGDLKERSIGIEVFGREPSYDANADPVVRITAGEVRKRLVQYYYDPAHTGELIIELPTGSYVPQFRLTEPAASQGEAAAEAEAAGDDAVPPAVQQPVAATNSFASGLIWGLVALAALGVGVTAGWRWRETRDVVQPTNIDRFWTPITAGTNTATYCLGEPSKNLDESVINSMEAPVPSPQPEQLYVRLHYSGHLALADVITLTRTAAALETRHKAFRVVPASEATFAQLREGPIVLIGAFDNIWTLRVTQKLRFGFQSKDGVALLVDRKSKTETAWATAWDLPYQKLSKDYAIVARFWDSTTGQPVIVAAGISEEGTEAAGEILYNPVYLDTLLAKLPPNWEQLNMEAVIETQVIQGHPGPPSILAVETW